jgi:hypothetical protein
MFDGGFLNDILTVPIKSPGDTKYLVKSNDRIGGYFAPVIQLINKREFCIPGVPAIKHILWLDALFITVEDGVKVIRFDGPEDIRQLQLVLFIRLEVVIKNGRYMERRVFDTI